MFFHISSNPFVSTFVFALMYGTSLEKNLENVWKILASGNGNEFSLNQLASFFSII